MPGSFAQLVAPTGLPLAVPFLDDQVIEACLAVRAHELTTPWQYKALTKAAMRGIVPPRSLDRVTTAEGSAEEEAGLRASRDDLLALCEGSRLAELGLVDPDRLRAGCHYSPAPDGRMNPCGRPSRQRCGSTGSPPPATLRSPEHPAGTR